MSNNNDLVGVVVEFTRDDLLTMNTLAERFKISRDQVLRAAWKSVEVARLITALREESST